MNPGNINDIVDSVLSGLNWNFIISCYGDGPDQLKYIVEKPVERKGKIIITHDYIKPTIELLQKDLAALLIVVINKNYHMFYFGHWTIRQISGADMKDNYGDSIEVMFTPCRYTVIEDKKTSKQTRKRKNTVQHIRAAFKERSSNKDNFNELLQKENDFSILEDMLKVCLDPKTEDYETAGKIHTRLKEIKKN